MTFTHIPAPAEDAADLLTRASTLVTGDRRREYGDPQVNFARIADLWEVILGVPVTSAQVALCLAGLKLARLIEHPTHTDSWVDLAGYAGLGGEVASTTTEGAPS